MQHVAIDLGGRESQLCARATDGSIVKETRVCTKSLPQMFTTMEPSRVILETSAEAFLIADAALASGHQVRVVPATLVKQLGVGARRIKNDRRDAQILSEVSCRIDLPSVHVPSALARELKSLCGSREIMVKSRTMLINNVRGWTRTQLIRIRTGSTPTFQDRVREYAQTHLIVIPEHIERQLVVLDSLKAQMKGADGQLARLASEHPVCRRLMTTPGIGPVTSVRFVAALDDVTRFRNAVDGDRAAIARGHTVVIYELPGGRQLRMITHAAAVNTVAFASGGHDLVSGAVDGSLLVTRDGLEPIALPALPGGIDAAAILADGRVVAAASKRLRVVSPGGAVLAELEIPARVRTLRPSPDGLRLLTVPIFTGDIAPAALWDLEHYRVIARLEDAGQALSARFVGRNFLTASGDGTARLWDGGTGRLLQAYGGGSRFLADATLTPDGALVVAGGGDGMLRFWDAADGRELWRLQAHRSSVVGVHFEGSDLITRGFGGEVARWTLPNPDRVIDACNAPEACGIVAK